MRANLKAARLSKGLSQEKLSRQIDIATRHYQDLEYGEKRGSIAVWERLSEALGEPVSHLFQQIGSSSEGRQ